MDTDHKVPGLSYAVYPAKFSVRDVRTKIDDPSIQKALRRFYRQDEPTVSVSDIWFECVMKELESFPSETIEAHLKTYSQARLIQQFDRDKPSFIKVDVVLLIALLGIIVTQRAADGVSVPGVDWEGLRRLIALGDTGAICEAQRAIDGDHDWNGLKAQALEMSGISSNARMEAFMPQREPIRPLSSTADGVYPVRSMFFNQGDKA